MMSTTKTLATGMQMGSRGTPKTERPIERRMQDNWHKVITFRPETWLWA